MENKSIPNKAHVKEWVIYQLHIRGLSFSELARREGASRSIPPMVFTVKSGLPKWERIIAAAIDMKPEDIWPELYAAREAKRAASLARKNTGKRRGRQ